MPEFKVHEAYTDPSAEEYKKKGNDAFKEQNWDEALKNYNKAISLDNTKAALFSNRAACWSSKGQHENALNDATKCIELDSSFVKGYSRKGKALFDLGRVEEAEAAYNEGLRKEDSNDACKQGVAACKAAKKAAGARRSSGGGVGGGVGASLNGLWEKYKGRLQSGGRGKMYLYMMGAYFVYNSFMRGGNRGGSSSAIGDDASEDAGRSGTSGTDDNDADVTQAPWSVQRGFLDVNGAWVSYLGGGSASGEELQLLLLHRTAASAETEFGGALARLMQEPSSIPSFSVFAPDRPCHGFSPCLAGNTLAGWLPKAVAKRRMSTDRLAMIASGRDSLIDALALARSGKVLRLLLLAPQREAPEKPGGDLAAWLQKLPAKSSVEEVADAARWAAATAASRTGSASSSDLGDERLPDGVTATIIYAEDDVEDGRLKPALEDLGVEVSVKRVKAVTSEVMAAEMQRFVRESSDDERA